MSIAYTKCVRVVRWNTSAGRGPVTLSGFARDLYCAPLLLLVPISLHALVYTRPQND